MAELTDVESLLELARAYEMAEMHTEMAEKMKELVILSKTDISKNARNLLSVAYKNLVGSKRSAWRVVTSIIEKYRKDLESLGSEERVKIEAKIKLIREKVLEGIVKNLKDVCNEVVGLLDDYLIKNAAKEDAEEKTFYYKMKGDYYRYLAEVLKGDDKGFTEACDNSEEAYKEASTASDDILPPTNPVLLGNKLNYSVFKYEIRNKPEDACKLAKEAFDKAIGELDGLHEDSYKDSTLIMQLLRDNLTLWTSEADGDKDGDNDKDED